jgi:16S rRNA (guanine966-N2)-methyltransferase
MSRVRLIAGIFGGRFLTAPDNTRTHPMSERVRGALFNMIDVEGRTVLDAFAGTGALGLEALSRGAKSVTFIERDRVAQKILAENVQTLDVSEKAQIIKASVSAWHETSETAKFDLIFADPPYHDMQLSTVTKLFSHLNSNALMVLSHPGRGETPTANGVVVVDSRMYGDAALTFYRREATN